jgi:hypothetical protein
VTLSITVRRAGHELLITISHSALSVPVPPTMRTTDVPEALDVVESWLRSLGEQSKDS